MFLFVRHYDVFVCTTLRCFRLYDIKMSLWRSEFMYMCSVSEHSKVLCVHLNLEIVLFELLV